MCYQLRRFIKKSPVDRFRRSAKKLVENIEKNAKWVEEHRRAVDFSPKDGNQLESFLKNEKAKGLAPLMKYNKQLQEQARNRRSQFEIDEVTVGGQPMDDLDEDEEIEGEDVFAGDWMPEKKATEENGEHDKSAKKKNKKRDRKTVDKELDTTEEAVEGEEDVMGEMDVFSDEEEQEEQGDDEKREPISKGKKKLKSLKKQKRK